MIELKMCDEPVVEFDNLLCLAVIDEVIVNHDGTPVLRFRNGAEVVEEEW